jgi:hypothetical protein
MEVAPDFDRPVVRKLYTIAGRFILIESDQWLAKLVDILLEMVPHGSRCLRPASRCEYRISLRPAFAADS